LSKRFGKKQKLGTGQVASCNPDTCSTKVCSPPKTNFSRVVVVVVAVVAVACLFVCLLFGDLLQLRSLELSAHEILHLICGLACSSGKDKIWRCDQAAVATDCLLIEAFSLWVY
jgi:hypothetical protein